MDRSLTWLWFEVTLVLNYLKIMAYFIYPGLIQDSWLKT